MNRHEKAEHLAKQALALMAERHITPTPDNFQLFYAYCAGENPECSRLIGDMIAGRRPFSPSVLADLRERFFANIRNDKETVEIGAKVSSTLDTVLGKLQDAGKHTEAYGKTLSVVSDKLDGDQSPEALKTLVSNLTAATRTMESRANVLEAELQRSSNEVHELRAKLETVRRESLTDPLTGIANRKAFDLELAKAMGRATADNQPLCVMMADIDHFKSFNDTWGHQTGDQVLRLVANCLSENVKGRDTAARYGGEEFCVILPDITLRDAAALADSIRMGVENKKLIKKSTGDILGTITISIGVASYKSGENAAALVQRADACLYAAKNAGRNRVVNQSELRSTAAA